MLEIKKGTNCNVRITLLTASGAVCDLRDALYYGVSLRLPSGSVIPCEDMSLDRVTNTLYVKLTADRELTTVGEYGIFANIKMLNNVMYSTQVISIVNISEDAPHEYGEVTLSLSMTAIDMPDNINATGASPYVGPNNTWLVYDDALKAYKDTGIEVGYSSLTSRINEIEATLPNKADLDPATKTILPSEVSPLLGRQRGVNTSSGFYKSTALKDTLTGSHTLFADFTTGDDVTTGQNVLDANNSNNGPRIYLGNGAITVYWGGSFSVPAIPNTRYMVAVSYDSASNEVVKYLNGLRYSTATASNYSVSGTFGIGSYSGAAGFFQGTFHSCRIFNSVLSPSEITALWNEGCPELYMLPEDRKGSGTNKCVAEYLPCGLLTDRWRDTSGNAFDLAAGGTPELSYASVQRLDEVILDTGLFVTDIAEGVASKSMTVPDGYAVTRISVYNANAGALTNVSAKLNGTAVFSGQGVAAASPLLVVPAVGLAYKTAGNTLVVNASGNTPEGGIRVKVSCKWIGF